ncbi:hypothetical protein HPB48_009427 [Haemaphysalis longicornis]|uniref:Uncharacterized protein n=1 Tax=Haemaphysalis longicornis TaxID=44386 RepID=A0A9J6GM15_HAELO|nr:hypothetical protein HPB48_009427 [Haemaphysalis longicornis]
MSATGHAIGNATCNASVNASVQRRDPRRGERGQDFVRLIKHVSPCADVRKCQDIMDRDEYYNLVRMTNTEHELLREIIHRETTLAAPPNTGTNTAYNAFVISASNGKAEVAVEGTTVHAAFKLSQKTTVPNKDGGLNASELNTLHVVFCNVKCVIIDEEGVFSVLQLTLYSEKATVAVLNHFKAVPKVNLKKVKNEALKCCEELALTNLASSMEKITGLPLKIFLFCHATQARRICRVIVS